MVRTPISGSARQLEGDMRFGDYVARRRKELGLSQKDLALLILKAEGGSISAQYLNDIEHNRRNPPTDDLLHEFARALQVSHEYLHYLAGEIPEDLRGGGHAVEEVEAAWAAFRKRLES